MSLNFGAWAAEPARRRDLRRRRLNDEQYARHHRVLEELFSAETGTAPYIRLLRIGLGVASYAVVRHVAAEAAQEGTPSVTSSCAASFRLVDQAPPLLPEPPEMPPQQLLERPLPPVAGTPPAWRPPSARPIPRGGQLRALPQLPRRGRGRPRQFVIHDGHHWPTAEIESPNKRLQATAEIRPDPKQFDPFSSAAAETARMQETMGKRVMAMDDETADVLDCVSHIWLQSARHPDEMADVRAEHVLQMRGLKPHLSGAGRRGGYSEKQRRDVAERIAALGTTWITVMQMQVVEDEQGARGPVRRPAPRRVAGAGRLLPHGQTGLGGSVYRPETCVAWRVRPGDVFARFLFGPGRQTALLSQKALAYDPFRHRWEKRLTRYLAWQWRIQKGCSNGRAVSSLLSAINETIDQANPSRTKERLEAALDRLEHDGVIAGWQYRAEDHEETIIGTRGWTARWLA